MKYTKATIKNAQPPHKDREIDRRVEMPILRTIEEKEHFSSLDLFKFLLAIMVIAFHTNPFEQCQIPVVDGG